VTETEVISLTARLRRGHQGLIVCQAEVEGGDEETRVEEVLGTGDDAGESVIVARKNAVTLGHTFVLTTTIIIITYKPCLSAVVSHGSFPIPRSWYLRRHHRRGRRRHAQ
jgi:hypothetical protein